MRKIISIIIISIITILVAILIFLTTAGIKTDNFNSLINEKVNEIDPKIKLKLNEVNFKLNPSNFEFEISTLDPQIAINEKNIDLENIKFDLNISEYISNKNPISEISIISKENDIDRFIDFINEYPDTDFRLLLTGFCPESLGNKHEHFSQIDKVKEFGGEFVEIILTGKDFYEAYDKSVVFCSQKKLNFIHPFNDYKIIEGQATLFLEILDQTDEKIDTLIIPIGGGGLISGAINVFKQLSKKTKIIGVQPVGAPTMKKSINQNKVITLSEIDNFVDGAAVRKVGDLTFDYCKKYLDDIIIIDEDEICKTILDLEKNHNIIAEPAGAMSITALRHVKEEIKGKNVVCIICGGNNDRRRIPEIQLRSNRWINQFLK